MDPEHAVRTTLELHELVVRAWCSGIARLCGRFPFSGTNPGVAHAISPGVLLFALTTSQSRPPVMWSRLRRPPARQTTPYSGARPPRAARASARYSRRTAVPCWAASRVCTRAPPTVRGSGCPGIRHRLAVFRTHVLMGAAVGRSDRTRGHRQAFEHSDRRLAKTARLAISHPRQDFRICR
jgi:hypothetical protein